MEKVTISIFFLLLALTLGARPQQPEIQTSDSLVFVPVSVVDTVLKGKNVFDSMPSNVSIVQSPSIRKSVEKRIASNHSRTVSGYRIRIFFDNGRDARAESQATLYRFKTRYPEVAAYRTFVSPYFKVTIGDFRTRSEALSMLSSLNHQFPSAFIVKENIHFPSLDGEKAFVVDTVKIRQIVRTDD